MICTEDEAKTKWCPFARLVLTSENFPSGNRFQENSFIGETRCIGSACMAWRALPAVIRDDTPINELELTVRAANALEQSGVRTLGDLRRLSGIDILRMRNVGRVTLAEIQDIMNGPPPDYLGQTPRGHCGLAGRPE